MVRVWEEGRSEEVAIIEENGMRDLSIVSPNNYVIFALAVSKLLIYFRVYSFTLIMHKNELIMHRGIRFSILI